jgi:cardiolipin synthase (CMP-forming)
MNSKFKVNIPNILTILRIIIIPFFFAVILRKMYITAVILFTIGGVSDFFDGYLARRYNIVSEFGKVADPLADKLMQFAGLLSLTINGVIEPVIIIIIGIKEFLMGVGTLVLFKRRHIVNGANWYGKITTFLIYLAVILLLLDIEFGRYILYVSVATTIFSFVMYGILAKKAISET